MFGSLGVPEILFLLVIALLIFGPRRLPEIGRTIGKGLSEFRRASSELKRSIDTEMTAVEREVAQEARKPAGETTPALLAAEPIRPAPPLRRHQPEAPPAGTQAAGGAPESTPPAGTQAAGGAPEPAASGGEAAVAAETPSTAPIRPE